MNLNKQLSPTKSLLSLFTVIVVIVAIISVLFISNSANQKKQHVTANAETKGYPATFPFISPTPTIPCTIYAAPNGLTTNNGRTPSTPKPLCVYQGASDLAQPGDTVCLMAGTYTETSACYPHGGTATGGYVTYTGNYNGVATIEGSFTNDSLVRIANNGSPEGSYIKWQNTSFNCMTNTPSAIKVSGGGHHVIIKNKGLV